MTKYNGWTNRETWLVNLHYSDSLYDFIKEQYAGYSYSRKIDADHNEMADSLEDYLMELIDYDNLDTFVTDMMGLSDVNWIELATDYFNDAIEDLSRIDD